MTDGKIFAEQRPAVLATPGVNYPVSGNDNTVLDSRYVLAVVDFPADHTANYYVTTRFNVVKVLNGQVYQLGKMLKTDSEDYPFIFKGDHKGTLFIDRSGKILTENHELAGYLRVS